MRIETNLELQSFYPADLEVANIYQTAGEITIKMFARSKNCPCPKCGTVSDHRHGTYESISYFDFSSLELLYAVMPDALILSVYASNSI